MRFQVGNDYVFSRILFERSEDSPFFGDTFCPWTDSFEDIEILVLTCKEHHKVSCDQDPQSERKYDGFRFVRADGSDPRFWDNQYPFACYGQTDTTNDKVIFPHYEKHEIFLLDANGDIKKDKNGRSIIVDKDKYAHFESTFWDHPFYLATSQLGKLYRAIHDIDWTFAQRKLLQDHLNMYVKRVEEACNKKVEFSSIVLDYLDGRKKVTSFIEANLF